MAETAGINKIIGTVSMKHLFGKNFVRIINFEVQTIGLAIINLITEER